MNEVQRKYLEYLKQEEKLELDNNQKIIDSFIFYCKDFGITLSSENFSFIRPIGIVASYPNIVKRLQPSILVDKEGLVDFDKTKKELDIKPHVTGYLFNNNYMVMAHPYFRRGFSGVNNYAPHFIDKFWQFSDRDVETFLSLDMDRVRVDVNDRMYFEADTWFGAEFRQNISEIKDGPVKLIPPVDLMDSHISFFYNDTYCLDIYWSTTGSIKSFYAEEFKLPDKTISYGGIEYHPARYVHAEFDLKQNLFRHFDGAVHLYNENEYYIRRDSDLGHNYKSESRQVKSASHKLFKLNGMVSIDIWRTFTNHFFTGDPLILEYLTGKVPDYLQESIDKLRENNISE